MTDASRESMVHRESLDTKLANSSRETLAIMIQDAIDKPLGTGLQIRNVSMGLMCTFPTAMKPVVKLMFRRKNTARGPKDVMNNARELGEKWRTDCWQIEGRGIFSAKELVLKDGKLEEVNRAVPVTQRDQIGALYFLEEVSEGRRAR